MQAHLYTFVGPMRERHFEIADSPESTYTPIGPLNEVIGLRFHHSRNHVINKALVEESPYKIKELRKNGTHLYACRRSLQLASWTSEIPDRLESSNRLRRFFLLLSRMGFTAVSKKRGYFSKG